MKCVIFCLLAFCIFETVFADQFDEDMINFGDKFENQMLAIQNTFSEAIDTEADAAGLLTGEYKYGYGCSGSSDKAMDRQYELRMKRCYQCIDEAYTDKNIQAAQDCCEEAVIALKTDEELIHAMATACIAKCTQPEGGCSEEIQNLHTLETEESKKNLDTDKSKETQNVLEESKKNVDTEKNKETQNVFEESKKNLDTEKNKASQNVFEESKKNLDTDKSEETLNV